jgi:ATP-dependent DNA helicase PIF1
LLIQPIQGKTVLLKRLVQALKNDKTRKGYVNITAATGIAALQLGGTTLHSFAGVGLAQESAETLLKKVSASTRTKDKWWKCSTLIIDEISMIDADLFEKIEYIARKIRNSQQPFGGIQVICTGDFLQLPPVVKGKFLGKKSPSDHIFTQPPRLFAFESSVWLNCFPISVELTQVFRQKEGPFVQSLGEIRRGLVSESTKEMFRKCVNRTLNCSDGIVPTVLYSRRAEVEDENKAELDKIESDEDEIYCAKDTGSDEFKDFLKKNSIAPDELQLKIGAQVMLCFNVEPAIGLVNGSRGVVTEFIYVDPTQYIDEKSQFVCPRARWPKVKFANGVEQVVMPEKWSVQQNEKEMAARHQLPLILAWALTVHKCQGLTLDRVILDLNSAFEKGQVYVALSRVRTLEGMCLKNSFPVHLIKAHPSAIKFYDEIRQTNENTVALLRAKRSNDYAKNQTALQTENNSNLNNILHNHPSNMSKLLHPVSPYIEVQPADDDEEESIDLTAEDNRAFSARNLLANNSVHNTIDQDKASLSNYTIPIGPTVKAENSFQKASSLLEAANFSQKTKPSDLSNNNSFHNNSGQTLTKLSQAAIKTENQVVKWEKSTAANATASTAMDLTLDSPVKAEKSSVDRSNATGTCPADTINTINTINTSTTNITNATNSTTTPTLSYATSAALSIPAASTRSSFFQPRNPFQSKPANDPVADSEHKEDVVVTSLGPAMCLLCSAHRLPCKGQEASTAATWHYKCSKGCCFLLNQIT